MFYSLDDTKKIPITKACIITLPAKSPTVSTFFFILKSQMSLHTIFAPFIGKNAITKKFKSKIKIPYSNLNIRSPYILIILRPSKTKSEF